MPTVAFFYPEGVTVGEASLRVVGDLSEVLAHVVDADAAVEVVDISPSERRYRYVNAGLGLKAEDYAPSSYQIGPAVFLAPRNATLGGKLGTFEDWDALGAWTVSLLSERSELPEEAAAEVRALCADATTDRERVQRVYRYMQKRTHYVGIQLGIGGFQPMDPADVHHLGYGDCKALSNYTRLLLEAVGVPAHYCVVGARDREIFLPDFASVSQANHAILGVPLPSDTMWLECTSQTDPADYSPSGWTAGRYVLWVDEAGSSLVRTEGLDPEKNTIRSQTVVNLTTGAKRVGFERVATYRGTTVAFPLAVQLAAPQERGRYVQRAFAKTISELETAASVEADEDGPIGTVRISGALDNYVQRVGSREIVPGFSFLRGIDAPSDTLNRRRPVRFETSSHREDVLKVVLPKGPQLTSIPKAVQLEGPHASYTLDVKADDESSGYTMTRRLTVRAGTYPPESAALMARFARDVGRADRQVSVVKILRP